MARVEHVGIKELKNNLSAWIQRVRKGSRVLVTLRDEVVAQIEPAEAKSEPMHPLLARWIREGIVRPGRGKGRYPHSPLRFPDGTAQRLLDEDRGD